ncbi:hypothetical protein GOBAR_AA38490 [Gossypium barbadense]|uniref:Piwi domain-containing protein n=1 Tax=Gossypium barbadense TaxID=3634 RepID=A0A2P5VTR2_GOSBA|nr:hypothetical protein GOBAR_AA38490 [Gossypium barbadense]
MTETGKNWHKKLPLTLYAYAGANTFNSSYFKVSDKVDDGIMKEVLLDSYTSAGKRKPDQIIIFRDGVSESQFNQVLIKLLRLGSPDNVLHGTVIDNKVCHPKNNDFYLARTAAGAIPFSWVYESRFFLQALMESRIEYL